MSEIKAVLFDIGGVVLGSPIVGVTVAEKNYSLPPHYINAHITAIGESGAFQRLERGEIRDLNEFYRDFGRELSDVNRANAAYRIYCAKRQIEVPKLPTELNIDGKELWATMMQPASTPDPIMINAINRLRASNRYQIGALTNNFHVPGVASPSLSSSAADDAFLRSPNPKRLVPFAALKKSLLDAAQDPNRAGSPNALLKSIFDVFVESAVEGLRKPDPKFYQIALDRLGLQAHQVVFLDDIGRNLVAARKIGLKTIRVHPDRSIEAVRELEELLGLPLQGELEMEISKL